MGAGSSTGTLQHIFLVWNLFLAWIPFSVSRYFQQYQKGPGLKKLILFGTWLLFFPNALYIITDLIHIRESNGSPAWFDAILLFTSAFLGLLLAYRSLHYAEQFLRSRYASRLVNTMMPVILFVASFGVCLGRFQRWNSWDIMCNPVALAEDIAECIFFPQLHVRSWSITIMLSILFYLIYAFSKILPETSPTRKNAG